MSKLTMSWPDRFAVMDQYNPTDEQIRNTFGLTQDELDTARTLRDAGAFAASSQLDCTKYATIFSDTSFTPSSTPPVLTSQPISVKSTKISSATTHAKPESASKRIKEPQKRGRKGDKIVRALAAVPTLQTPVSSFIQQHGVSLAVLRQSKRFIEKLPAEQQATIGKINVRQDKASKQLMIWRETT